MATRITGQKVNVRVGCTAVTRLAELSGIDTSDTARLFAMVWTGFADSFIGCMNAKYHFSFWRPVTAIGNAGLAGNPLTIADPT